MKNILLVLTSWVLVLFMNIFNIHRMDCLGVMPTVFLSKHCSIVYILHGIAMVMIFLILTNYSNKKIFIYSSFLILIFILLETFNYGFSLNMFYEIFIIDSWQFIGVIIGFSLISIKNYLMK